MKKYTLDRFEGKYAVLLLRENEEIQIDINKKDLPSVVKEGDILEVDFSSGGEVKEVNVLSRETDLAKKRAQDLIQKLINKSQKQ